MTQFADSFEVNYNPTFTRIQFKDGQGEPTIFVIPTQDAVALADLIKRLEKELKEKQQ